MPAGYVCHKLIKQLGLSSMSWQIEMITNLTDLASGEGDGTKLENRPCTIYTNM